VARLEEILGFSTLDMHVSERCMLVNALEMAGDEQTKMRVMTLVVTNKPCSCLNSFPCNIMAMTALYVAENFHVMGCNAILLAYEFFLSEHRYPNRAEFDSATETDIHRRNDPYFFNEESEAEQPTENLDLLEDKVSTKACVCAICMEDIGSSQRVFEIPSCGHMFHSTPGDCLGQDTIKTWLKTHDSCPVCKTTVEIPRPAKKSKTTH